jgi:hypothetical protein
MQVIAHPTDFSECSAAAFSHAVGMALTTKSHLYLLHVREPGSSESWTSFPHVRELLARWELMDLRERPSQIEAKLGVGVTKVEIQHEDPAPLAPLITESKLAGAIRQCRDVGEIRISSLLDCS